jgi:hypothetical protein
MFLRGYSSERKWLVNKVGIVLIIANKIIVIRDHVKVVKRRPMYGTERRLAKYFNLNSDLFQKWGTAAPTTRQ